MISIGLIILTGIVSYQGFNDYAFFDKYKFHVGRILYSKDYTGLVSSGFLHGSWTHLLFNMFSLYAFSQGLENALGIPKFLGLYFITLVAGNLFSLFINKDNSNYSAIGASGAVSGVIFACIALFPGMEISLMFIPIGIPSWLYGILFVAYSIYGMRAQNDNIGHEAHLGGALAGMLIAIFFVPDAWEYNKLIISGVFGSTAVFTYIFVTKPDLFR